MIGYNLLYPLFFGIKKSNINNTSVRSLAYRSEQKTLRKFLIDTKEYKCIICNNNFPLFLLEASHLKPRYLLSKSEIKDKNNVEFMCRNCHKLYENGWVGITNFKLDKNNKVQNYNFVFNDFNENIYTENNKSYFDYHYLNNFKKTIQYD